MYLCHRIHGDSNDNEKTGTAEIEGHGILRDQEFRKDTHGRQISSADHGQPSQHVIEIFGRVRAGADTGDKAAVAFQIVGGVNGIEDNGRVEEGEEHDQADVEHQVERLAVAQESRDGGQPLRTAAAREARHGQRHEQQGGGEDRRNHAGDVQLQRQMRGLTAEHLVADLTLRILHHQAALGPLHEDDEGDDRDDQDDQQDDDAGGFFPNRGGYFGLKQLFKTSFGEPN